MTILMLVGYYLVGASAAAWVAEHGGFDSRLGLLVLPLMYLAHLAFNAIVRKREGGNRACLGCQGEIGLFRRVARHRFCSDEHEHQYFAELDELAIQRLRIARPASAERHEDGVSHEISLPVPAGQQEQSLVFMGSSAVAAFGSSPA